MSNFFHSVFQHRRVHELTAQLAQRGELVDQLERQLIELRRNMTDLAGKYRESMSIVQDLELLLEEARTKELEQENDFRTERAARTTAEAELRTLLESIAARGDVAEQSARASLAELEQVKGALQAALAEVAGERRMRKSRETDVRTLQEDLAARKASGAELESNFADLTSQHGELADALRTVSGEMQTLSAEIRARDKELEHAREEIAHAAARLAEIESRLRLEENAAQSSRTALAQTEAMLQQEREARAQLEQALRGKIDSLIERREQIKGAVHNASTELERVRAALQLAEQELAAGRAQHKSDVEAARSAAKASDQSRKETKALLREAHDALRAERDATRVLGAALDRELSERARLAHELAHNPAQLRMAALEEEIHEHLARALDVSEPVAVDAEAIAPQRALFDPAKSPALDRGPKRLIVIASEDNLLLDAATAVMSTLVSGSPLPLAAGDIRDLDDWLGQALAAEHDPKVAVLPVNEAVLAAVTAQTHEGHASTLAALLVRAHVLHLVWSDKCLAIAHRQVFGAVSGGDSLDDGDARMSVPLYRDLIRREQRLQRGVSRSGLFKAADIAKLYAETADAAALIQFCRDGGFPIKASKLARASAVVNVDDATIAFARRIRAAVEAQVAQNDPDTGPLPVLARAQERAGRYAEALTSYEQALREQPGDFGARLMLATYLELAGRVAEAETVLRETADGDAQAANALRDLYRRIGDDEKVLAAAELMRQAGAPQSALAVAAAAAALERTEDARRALSDVPSDMGRSEALQRTKAIVELQESLPGLQDAAEHGGAQDWFALAETLRQLDKVEAATQAYLRAENASPGLLARTCGEGVGPDLLLIGPPRTSTTLLRRALELHPSVALLDGESSFLSNDHPISLASFVERVVAVRARKPDAVIGDKSPLHFTLSPAHVALAALLFPQVRIIVTTREPVERAFSQIKLFGHRRVTEASIAAALSNGAIPRWLDDVLENSRYRKHLKTWAAHFSAERVLLLQSEEFERNIAANCERLFAWLGLQAPAAEMLARLQKNWSNRTAAYRLDPNLERLLRAQVGDEPHKVRDLEAAMKGRAARASAAPR
jgi:tetratricopeptide (TPR) repeat protein